MPGVDVEREALPGRQRRLERHVRPPPDLRHLGRQQPQPHRDAVGMRIHRADVAPEAGVSVTRYVFGVLKCLLINSLKIAYQLNNWSPIVSLLCALLARASPAAIRLKLRTLRLRAEQGQTTLARNLGTRAVTSAFWRASASRHTQHQGERWAH